MPRNTIRNKKESGNSGENPPDRKKPMKSVRRGGGNNNDDDDSVDSRGNIRGLISYSDVDDTSLSSDEKPKKKPKSTPKAKRVTRSQTKKEVALKPVPLVKVPSFTSIASSKSVKSPRNKLTTPKKEVEDLMDIESESEESEEEEESVEDTAEEDDESDEYETESDDEDSKRGSKRVGAAEISISFGGMGGESAQERLIPKRHNMKKESEITNKFVKLISEPRDAGGIDEQIDQFNSLPADKQKQLVASLERRPAVAEENMMFKILTMNLSAETQAIVLAKYNALQGMDPSSGEYYKHRAWLEKLTSLPLGIYKEMPVKLDDGPDSCGAFMERARKHLGEAIYGQEESKLQILQFIASKIANSGARGLSLLLLGPPGIGKTSLIKNGIAKALNWPFQFISLGGDSDATTYTGHQLVYEGSHAGKIVNSLATAKSMSMVLMFDELDKISATPKGEEVQNLLIHMTDAVQNCDFEDKYLSGIPLDLSRTMFVFSGNDINKIDKVLLDRMIVIQLEGYEKKDKLAIAEAFLLPSALKDVNLQEKVLIGKDVLEHIIAEYAGKESGVRELKRCIEQITQKVNMLRIFNTKDLPFHIPDFQLPFVVRKHHVDLFLKKNEPKIDMSVRQMYV